MPDQPLQPPKGVFITGTDTNVGKTVVTAALGMALQQTGGTVGIMKPVETGTTRRRNDVGWAPIQGIIRALQERGRAQSLLLSSTRGPTRSSANLSTTHRG